MEVQRTAHNAAAGGFPVRGLFKRHLVQSHTHIEVEYVPRPSIHLSISLYLRAFGVLDFNCMITMFLHVHVHKLLMEQYEMSGQRYRLQYIYLPSSIYSSIGLSNCSAT